LQALLARPDKKAPGIGAIDLMIAATAGTGPLPTLDSR